MVQNDWPKRLQNGVSDKKWGKSGWVWWIFALIRIATDGIVILNDVWIWKGITDERRRYWIDIISKYFVPRDVIE